MRKKKPVTLKHLAEELNLSIMTVSKAIRGLPGMSEETRKQVIELAQDLGYRTKEQEQIHAVEHIPLYNRKPFRFKFIISDTPESVELNQLILAGLQRKLSEYGHFLETIIVPYHCNQRASLQEWADTHQLDYSDGFFIPPMVGAEQEDFLLKCGKPCILINFPKLGVKADSVVWDSQTAILQSVQFLLSKGHRRIMYVGDIRKYRGHVLRWQTFVKTITDAGIPFHADDHVTEDDGHEGDRATLIVQKLKQYQPTAILAAQSYDLAWIYYACSTLGKTIPEDYSLISPELTENRFIPQLSRPLLMMQESGVRAAERMLWRIANPHLPYEHIYLQGSFYEGTTVRDICASRDPAPRL